MLPETTQQKHHEKSTA